MTASSDVETVREALHVLTAISFSEPQDVATIHEASLEAYAALDRLVARNQQLQEALALASSEIVWCIGFVSSFENRRWVNSLTASLKRAHAALASVRARSEA